MTPEEFDEMFRDKVRDLVNELIEREKEFPGLHAEDCPGGDECQGNRVVTSMCVAVVALEEAKVVAVEDENWHFAMMLDMGSKMLQQFFDGNFKIVSAPRAHGGFAHVPFGGDAGQDN